MSEQDTSSDWYVLGAHSRRAIGYLGAALAERGDLPVDFEQPQLLDLWGEALKETMDGAERSPICESAGGVTVPVDEEREEPQG